MSTTLRPLIKKMASMEQVSRNTFLLSIAQVVISKKNSFFFCHYFTHYLLFFRITGGELFDRIIELQRYTEKDATRVLTQALLGLKAMHEKGFAHRDIKVIKQ